MAGQATGGSDARTGVWRTARTMTAAFLAVVLAACAGRTAGAGAGSPRPVGGGSAAGAPLAAADSLPPALDPAARAEIEALFRARADSALRNFTEADVRFVTGMIAHHAQALVMAGLAPSHGAGAQIRTLAARIATSQEDEIATMRRWLRDRGLPEPQIHVDGVELTVHGADHAAHAMPGMLSLEQMRGLDRARGGEFDRLFLTFMIQHHRGALVMVDELLATDGAALDPPVFKLAAEIHAEQATEIARMEHMLDGLSPRSLP